MFWKEDKLDDKAFVVPDDVADLVFTIQCSTLPVDHAHDLSRAIHEALPWFMQEEQAALHLIHGAESGNGWERPEGEGDVIYLSRRTKLTLRLPKHRLDEARTLSGSALDVAGNTIHIKEAKLRLFSTNHTLYSRHLVDENGDEELFMEEAVAVLNDMGLSFKKVLCGRSHTLQTPEKPLQTRSLMVAELPPTDAVTLQQRGMGNYQKLGCGLFIPHKTLS
jgi:CRISPR-associated protein Cas6